MTLEQIVADVLQTASEMLVDRQCTDVRVDRDALQVSSAQCVVLIVDPHVAGARVGVQHVRAAKTHGHRHIIFVAPNGATAYLAGRLPDVEDCTVEVFQNAQLLRNVTKHVLVPKHTLVPPGEVHALLRTHGLDDTSQLPCILPDDAIVRYYNWPPGSVIRIVRRDIGDNGLVVMNDALRCVQRVSRMT